MAILQRNAREWLVLQPGNERRSVERPSRARAAERYRADALSHLGRSALRAFTRARLDMDVRWHAALPEGPKILAANHPTTTDPFYILTLLKEPVSVLVTTGAFAVNGFGWYLRAAGHVPAVRGSGGSTVEAVVRQIESGRSVAIFPEGALSPLEGGVHRAHSGVARVALRTGAPVIPVGIGLRRDLIRVREVDLPHGSETGHLYMKGPYAMTVGRPKAYAGDHENRDRVRAVADEVMRHVRRLARESDRRVSLVPAPAPRLSARLVRAW